MQKLRIVTLRFRTGRQRMALERWTNPKPQRRACSPRYGVPLCGGKSAGVAKRRRERSPTRNPVNDSRLFHRCMVPPQLHVRKRGIVTSGGCCQRRSRVNPAQGSVYVASPARVSGGWARARGRSQRRRRSHLATTEPCRTCGRTRPCACPPTSPRGKRTPTPPPAPRRKSL
jgi:hypothetical protein